MDIQKQKGIINALYIMLILSTILSFVPVAAAQIGSLALIFAVLIGAYYYKAKDSEDGLLHNHMTYLIGTVWIGGAFLVIGMIAAAIWISGQSDNTALDNIIQQMSNGVMLDEAMLKSALTQYITDNQSLLLRVTLLTIGPAILYFVYRIANGYARALRGYRIAKPKSWL